ncbi:MAG: hypothetical protein ACLQF0_06765 [Dissulfurispiraceae bacterium]
MKATTVAFLTEATCGEACWHAKEDICRCSCGGKNHGILLSANGEQPVRQSKIDGHRYQMLAVGPRSELYKQCDVLLKALPPSSINRVTATSYLTGEPVEKIVEYKYYWSETDKGSPYRLKPATPQQCALWPELAAFKDLEVRDFYRISPCILWEKVQ